MNLASQKIKMINIEDIKPNPYQCRRNFNLRKLNKLAASIKTVGILSPLLLRTTSTGFEIIFGHRRFRAATIAGLKTVPAVVVRAGDKQCAQLSLIENMHRENLTLFEEAEAFYNLLSYHNVKKDEIAEFLSVETDEINGKAKLLGIEPAIRYKIEENSIPESTVKELLKIHDAEKQKETADLIINESLNKEDASSFIRQVNREMTRNKRKNNVTNIPLCKNTVKRTVNILKENGEKVEFEQKEDEKYIEFHLKIRKQGIF